MAASQNVRTLFQLVLAMVGVLIVQTEAGLLPAATPLVAALPQQLYARSAYSQVVGRSYAPSSFVPVASAGIAYATAPIVAPQLAVAGPVLKTLAPARALPVAPALSYAALPGLAYAAGAPVPTAFAPAALARAYAPLPALPAPTLASAPLDPALAPVAPSLPGVFDARTAPNDPATRTTNPAIVSAFGSPAGIRLVGLPDVQSVTSNGQNPQEQQTSVEIARGSPAERSATSGTVGAASNQEAFGVPVPSQPSPFNEYGVPAPVTSRVNP